jgi:hypothetical protein
MGKKSNSVTANYQRITLSVRPDVISRLDSMSALLGVSRSALTSAYLEVTLPFLVSSIENSNMNMGHSRRYRGDIVNELKALIRDIGLSQKELNNELFKN